MGGDKEQAKLVINNINLLMITNINKGLLMINVHPCTHQLLPVLSNIPMVCCYCVPARTQDTTP